MSDVVRAAPPTGPGAVPAGGSVGAPGGARDAELLLRLHGVQVTAQRLALMRAVASRPHATADVLADEVRGVIGTVSRQAVYDSLGVLVDRGLLRRIQPAGSAARYEDRVGDNHHHLICRDCGATVDVDCAVGDVPCLSASDDHGYDIDEAEVIYWGRCPTCRSTTASTPTTTGTPGTTGRPGTPGTPSTPTTTEEDQ